MNKDTETALDGVFGIAPAPVNTPTEMVVVPEVLPPAEVAPVEVSLAERQAQEDYEFSRGALKTVAAEAQNTLHRAVEVAEQTDTPRAFEAVADMVRATLESHRELQSLHKTAAEIRMATKTATAPTTNVNIDKGVVFSGGPDELLRLIDPSRQ